MKSSAPMRFAAVVATIFAAVASGCLGPHQPEASPPSVDLSLLEDLREAPDFNKAEVLDQQIVLPPSWDGRHDALERLVGTALVLIPDGRSSTGHRIELLGHLLTPEGTNSVQIEDIEGRPRYRSRVEGSLAPSLSFVPGRLDVRGDSVYELTVTEGRMARGAAEARSLDRRKMERALSRLPKRYRDVFLVTGATQLLLTAQEYRPWADPTGEASAVLRLGADYFRGAGAPVRGQALCLNVVSAGALFGDITPKSCFYVRKKKLGKLRPKDKSGSLVSFQTMRIVRESIAANGLPFPE